MPFGGEFSARTPGEARSFSFDFFGDLAAGDQINSATTTLVDPTGTDPNAATLLASAPTILNGQGTASVVAQKIGTNSNNLTGFVAGVIYLWTITATTVDGDTLVWYEKIPIMMVI